MFMIGHRIDYIMSCYAAFVGDVSHTPVILSLYIYIYREREREIEMFSRLFSCVGML